MFERRYHSRNSVGLAVTLPQHTLSCRRCPVTRRLALARRGKAHMPPASYGNVPAGCLPAGEGQARLHGGLRGKLLDLSGAIIMFLRLRSGVLPPSQRTFPSPLGKTLFQATLTGDTCGV